MESDLKTEGKKGTAMEILIPLVLLVVWIILQAWVLPHLGVKT
jgi:hypothetical protein